MKSYNLPYLPLDTGYSQHRQQIGRRDGNRRTNTHPRPHNHFRTRSHRKQQQKLKRRLGAGYEMGLNTSATILATTLAMCGCINGP